MTNLEAFTYNRQVVGMAMVLILFACSGIFFAAGR